MPSPFSSYAAPDMTSGEETAASSVTCSATELDVPFTAAGMLRKRDAASTPAMPRTLRRSSSVKPDSEYSR